MEPEHLRYIYTSKTKDKTTFSVCLAEGITTNFINEDLFAGMEAVGYTIAAKAYGMLPGKSDVEWYRFIRESATWSTPTPGKTNAGRGAAHPLRNAFTPISTLKPSTSSSSTRSLDEDGFQLAHRKRTTETYSDILTQSQPSLDGSSLTSAAGGLNSASLNE
jgi:hypothetical protein